jgi:hypothetical protein
MKRWAAPVLMVPEDAEEGEGERGCRGFPGARAALLPLWTSGARAAAVLREWGVKLVSVRE